MTTIQVGTARASAGQITYGWLDGVTLPTGGKDRFPVIVAQGDRGNGPILWVTASIHGGEHTGLVVAQRLVTKELVSRLNGTLVVIPTLNPAGLRTKERSPYYFSSDPNRSFPEPRQNGQQPGHNSGETISELEAAYQRIYQAISASGADLLLDLHNAQIGSLPMVFRDPVFYQRGRGNGLNRQEATALQARLGALLESMGFSIINEFAAESYVDKRLHRSVSGAVLNGIGIPAVTVELGSWMHVDPGVAEAALSGIRNAMRWAGMLDDAPEPVTGIPVICPPYPVRRHVYPYAPQAGIVHHLIRPGEPVRKGQPILKMADIHGRPVGENPNGTLYSEYEGYVIAWQHGVVRYQGEPIMVLAIRDDAELVRPYPY